MTDIRPASESVDASSPLFDQSGYRVKLEWGRRGARVAAARGDMVVIVDVLRFSTTVATAIHHGGAIYPCRETEDVQEVAARLGAHVGVKSGSEGNFTLSPATFASMAAGTRVAIASLNGSMCVRAAQSPQGASPVFVGALVNARAVGTWISTLLREQPEAAVTVVACGERWGDADAVNEDGALRVALEDYLGAGAICAHLPFPKSPEARLSEAAFSASQDVLLELLTDCGSARELAARGQAEDVAHAAKLNCYAVVPTMLNGWLVDAKSAGACHVTDQ